MTHKENNKEGKGEELPFSRIKHLFDLTK